MTFLAVLDISAVIILFYVGNISGFYPSNDIPQPTVSDFDWVKLTSITI